MANQSNITAEYVRSILEYDQDTGVFIWKHRQDCDAAWNGKWAGKKAGSLDNRSGRYQISINKKIYLYHRVAYIYMMGKWPTKEIDHADGNPSNNSWLNLRLADRCSQNQNRSGFIGRNGLKGVRFHNPTKKWQSRLRDKHLGLFDCPAVASFVYQIEADKNYGEFARPF